MKVKLIGILTLVLAFFTINLFAEVKTKFYGYQWLRYTDIVLGADKQSDSGISIPRTYLRWKIKDKDAGWGGEITLDIASEKGGQIVDAKTSTINPTSVKGKVDFAIWPKYAYVDFTAIPILKDIDMKLRVGQQKNYFGTVELWEYPLIEKTITDLRKVIASADLGIALLGDLPEGYGQYELAMHNGSGYKNLDSNVEKQYTGSLMLLPISGLMLRGSYMINNQSAHGTDSKIKRASDFVAQYTINFLPVPMQILGEYVVVENPLHAGVGKSGVSVGYMLFGSIDLIDWMQFAFRFDNWNADTSKANDETNLYIAGVNLKINEKNLLQLNYQLEQPQFGGYPATSHINTLMAQLKWSW